MTLVDLCRQYPNNEALIKLLEKHLVSVHILAKTPIDGCESLGEQGTHYARTIATIKTVGFGKIIEESKLYDKGNILYMTSTGNRVVFDASGRLITFLPQSAPHIRRKFPTFAATTRGKQLCKLVTEQSKFNIWDFGDIR